MTVYRLNALDQTGARVHRIQILEGRADGLFNVIETPYTHPAPAESPGPVEDFCNLCNAALKALNP